MRGHKHRWLAALLTASLAGALPAAAWGQFNPALPGDPAYVDPAYSMAGQGAGVETQLVSNFNADQEKDLAMRVKDLESALKKMKDKEAADKKKAASAMSVRPLGRIFVDQVFFGQNAASRAAAPVGLGDAQDTTYFRAARIGLEGTGFDVAYYRIEMDFVGRSTLNLSNPPGGTVTAE